MSCIWCSRCPISSRPSLSVSMLKSPSAIALATRSASAKPLGGCVRADQKNISVTGRPTMTTATPNHQPQGALRARLGLRRPLHWLVHGPPSASPGAATLSKKSLAFHATQPPRKAPMVVGLESPLRSRHSPPPSDFSIQALRFASAWASKFSPFSVFDQLKSLTAFHKRLVGFTPLAGMRPGGRGAGGRAGRRSELSGAC